MYPYLARIGSVTIHTYGVVLVAAFLVAIWLTGRALRDWPSHLAALSPGMAGEWGSLTMLGGLVGGRAWYVLQHWDVFVRQPMEIPAVWHGGLVWYGGFLGGVLATWACVRHRRLPLLRVLDQVVPFVALGHGIGRIGCLLNGCCFGEPTNAWFGMVFPLEPEVIRMPTQAFEALALVALYALLRTLQRPAVLSRPGTLFGIYLIGYALVRFLLEFLRGDQTASWGPWTIPQLVSLPVGVVGLLLVVVQWGRHGAQLPSQRRTQRSGPTP